MIIKNNLQITTEVKSFGELLQNHNIAQDKSKAYLLTSEFAEFLDSKYSLKHLRSEFHYPKSLTLPKGIFIYLF